MKPVNARLTRALQHYSIIPVCDNSGAKLIKVTSVMDSKTNQSQMPALTLGELFMGSVKKGKPEMRKQVVFAVLVRQKKEFRRPDGLRIKFEDNAAVVLKDDKGNPKGTLIKGPIAKEVAVRWPSVAKLASMVL